MLQSTACAVSVAVVAEAPPKRCNCAAGSSAAQLEDGGRVFHDMIWRENIPVPVHFLSEVLFCDVLMPQTCFFDMLQGKKIAGQILDFVHSSKLCFLNVRHDEQLVLYNLVQQRMPLVVCLHFDLSVTA